MHNNQHGFTAVELLLALVVGSIVLAAAFTSYTIIGNQHKRITALTEVQSSGIPTIRFVSRDIRMAGNIALDPATLDSTYGAITTPITITDSGTTNCCDEFTVIYDKAVDDRVRIAYFFNQRTNPTRNALYFNLDTYDGSGGWTSTLTDILVTDYVEDFQLEETDIDGDGVSDIVDISLIIRNKNNLKKDITYSKPTYDIGNRDINTTDRFHRDEFNATIYLRNINE